MTEVEFRYETPSAFRKALKDRFGQIARTDRRYSLDELQRQFAYDRFGSPSAFHRFEKVLGRLACGGSPPVPAKRSVWQRNCAT